MRRREQGSGRGQQVEDAYFATLRHRLAPEWHGPPDLDHLTDAEVTFVSDLLADRAGSGALVTLIERRFGRYRDSNRSG